jgi:hypothetical protein
MSTEGQKHAAKLAELEGRKKKLEDALMRLARDEAESLEVSELAQDVEQLEQQVDAARTALNIPNETAKRTAIMTHDIRKQALSVKKIAEKQLDDFAKSLQQPGETFEAAYSRVLDTEMGAMMLTTLGDSQALATGNPTEFDLEKARAALR